MFLPSIPAGACPVASMQAPATVQEERLISWRGLIALLFLLLLGLAGAFIFAWAWGSP